VEAPSRFAVTEPDDGSEGSVVDRKDGPAPAAGDLRSPSQSSVNSASCSNTAARPKADMVADGGCAGADGGDNVMGKIISPARGFNGTSESCDTAGGTLDDAVAAAAAAAAGNWPSETPSFADGETASAGKDAVAEEATVLKAESEDGSAECRASDTIEGTAVGPIVGDDDDDSTSLGRDFPR
jgi:hypothetical protein